MVGQEKEPAADQAAKPKGEDQAAKPADQSQKQARVGKPAPTPDAMFRKHRVLPDAKTIFSHAIPPLAKVKDRCIVVPDASVLLAPYQEIGKTTLGEIKATYETLIGAGRFIIPGQVAREFASNRPRLIGDVINTLSSFAKELHLKCGEAKPELPILQHATEFDAFSKAWTASAKSLGDLQRAFGDVIDAVKSWALNDPISLIYRKLFKSEIILDLPIDEQKLPAELRKRFDHKIPPGYIDEGKDDGGIGDYLIWLTILEIGRTHNRPVLFVTGEKKADWVHGSVEGPFSPRFELLEEFRQASGGQGFYVAPLHIALQLFGVKNQETLDQVKRSERVVSEQLALPGLNVDADFLFSLQQHQQNMQQMSPLERRIARRIEYLDEMKFMWSGFLEIKDVEACRQILGDVTAKIKGLYPRSKSNRMRRSLAMLRTTN